MDARSATHDSFPLTALRWLMLPAVGWAMVNAAAAMIRRRAREPRVSPMSDEWLRTRSADREWYSR